MSVSVRRLPLLALAVAGLTTAQVSFAQTTSVATNPVGYVQLTCSAASDTTVSVPFQQPAAFVGLVASVSGSTVTVSGTAGWTANQFVYSGSGSSTYYAQLGPYSSGTDPWDGSYYTITSNGSNTLTIDTNNDNLSNVPAGSTVSVIPFWTVGTVFPPSQSGTAFIASPSTLSHQTTVLVPNISGTGTNLGLSNTYYFYNGAWRKVGYSASNSYNDDILLPDCYMTVRNPSSTTTLTTMGSVLTGNFITALNTQTSGAQDNPVAIVRPVDTSLNNLGLITSGAFTPSTSSISHNDTLIVLSNTNGEFSPPPAATYYYYAGTSGTGWQQIGQPFTLTSGTCVVPAGSGFIVRKIATNNGAPAYWQNPPSY